MRGAKRKTKVAGEASQCRARHTTLPPYSYTVCTCPGQRPSSLLPTPCIARTAGASRALSAQHWAKLGRQHDAHLRLSHLYVAHTECHSERHLAVRLNGGHELQ